MNKFNLNIILIIIMIFLNISGIIILIKYCIMFNNIMNVNILEKYVQKNNLELPFPKSETNIYTANKGNNILTLKLLQNSSLFSFYKTLKQNYKYSSEYDCKYWTYIWLLWLKYHPNLKYQVIKLPNHIFVVAYNSSKYYIMDQNNLIPISLK